MSTSQGNTRISELRRRLLFAVYMAGSNWIVSFILAYWPTALAWKGMEAAWDENRRTGMLHGIGGHYVVPEYGPDYYPSLPVGDLWFLVAMVVVTLVAVVASIYLTVKAVACAIDLLEAKYSTNQTIIRLADVRWQIASWFTRRRPHQHVQVVIAPVALGSIFERIEHDRF